MSVLNGVRVIDFTQAYPGPFCTMNLADFGAEVIKIEDTGAGDYARTMGAMAPDRARRIAREIGLKHVYTGNVHDVDGDTTRCTGCGKTLIVRDWYEILSYRLDAQGRCPDCGTPLAGRFGAVGAARGEAFGAQRIPVAIHRR